MCSHVDGCVCECFAGQEAQQAGPNKPVLKALRSSIIKSERLSGTWIMANWKSRSLMLFSPSVADVWVIVFISICSFSRTMQQEISSAICKESAAQRDDYAPARCARLLM